MAVSITTGACAQQTLVGFSAGATLANYSIRSGENTSHPKTKAGFTVGAVANFPISKGFMIQSGVNFVQKNTRDKNSFFGITYKYSSTTNHIEVPVNFLYTNSGFFVGAGPSFSFGISGKWKSESNNEKTEENIHFGNGENDDMKSFDIGGNVLGGYQFKNGIFIAANYTLGLRNLVVESSGSDMKVNSRYFGIRVGYMIQNPKKK